jgi:hypothetical protein
MLPNCRFSPFLQQCGHVSKHSAGSIWASDVPTWVTAVATVGLLIGAIITARYAIKAFGKQSEQLADQREINEEQTKVLKLQATELDESIKERKRESAERRRAQANRVFVSVKAYVESGEPISTI